MELFMTVGGAVISTYFLFSQKKSRLDPLKNSEKVKVDINSETSLDSFTTHLPAPHFTKNMNAAIDTEQAELGLLWSSQKATFGLMWKGFSDRERRYLLKTLLDELTFTIEIYSDTNELLRILCPKLNVDYFMTNGEIQDVLVDGVVPAVADDNLPTIQKYIMAVQNKGDIKQYCLPLLVVGAERVEKELDPNGQVKVDAELAGQVDLFLRALQHLCAIKFAKQVLLRYKVDPQKSLTARLVKKLAPLVLFGLLAALLAYLLDKYGFFAAVMWKYQSPFK